MATTTRSHPLPRRGEKFTWKLFHYVRPNSLTWWAGLLSMLTGIASLALPTTGPLSELSRLVALLAGSGDASPAGLMFLGLGLIGLRDRIERGFRGDA